MAHSLFFAVIPKRYFSTKGLVVHFMRSLYDNISPSPSSLLVTPSFSLPLPFVLSRLFAPFTLPISLLIFPSFFAIFIWSMSSFANSILFFSPSALPPFSFPPSFSLYLDGKFFFLLLMLILSSLPNLPQSSCPVFSPSAPSLDSLFFIRSYSILSHPLLSITYL